MIQVHRFQFSKKKVLVSLPTMSCTGWITFYCSRNYGIIISLCIQSYYVFAFVWLYKDTAPWNSFRYSQLWRITCIKNYILIVLSSFWELFLISWQISFPIKPRFLTTRSNNHKVKTMIQGEKTWFISFI